MNLISRKEHTRTWNSRKRQFLLAMLFVSPFTIGFIIFNLYPVIMSLYYSFTDFNILQSPHWVMFDNYKALIGDPLFWKCLWNTFYLILIGVPLSTIVGIGVAILLNTKIPGQGVFRTLIYMPSVVPPVAVALLWTWLLNPNFGLVNSILGFFHINGPGWLADPNWSKPAIVIMLLWGIGNVIVIYLAALNEVSTALFESSQLDGANKFQTLIYITLPSISNVIFYNVITGVIAFMQFFAQGYVVNMAAANNAGSLGAPSNSTLFFGLYLFQNGFSFLKMGEASAMGWIMLLLSLLGTWLLLRYSDTFEAN